MTAKKARVVITTEESTAGRFYYRDGLLVGQILRLGRASESYVARVGGSVWELPSRDPRGRTAPAIHVPTKGEAHRMVMEKLLRQKRATSI